ncbi:MAG: hypothetical protein JWR07_3493 [Nevskia sp.]|nr:hypothetical protein [Nevskia sp.]
MTATVHPLFSGSPQERGEQTVAPVPSHPLVAELREVALSVLDELVRRMFDSADDVLFEMGEKSSTDDERRRYFDTMRVLRLDRGKVGIAFADDLTRGFAPVVAPRHSKFEFDLDSLSIQPTEELEEKIAVTNMAAKAEGLYKNPIWELERHLDFAVRELGVPVSPLALGPGRICDAFGKATGVLDTEFQVKLVIYKLFDRVVINELGKVYIAALEVLERHGVSPSRRTQASSPLPEEEAELPPPLPGYPPHTPHGGSPGYGQGAGNQPYGQGYAQAQELLRRYSLDQASVQRASNPVGAELAGLLQTLITGASSPAVQASTQRLSLAGRMFDDLMAEPMLPEPLRPALEKLRYPVYKTALSDPSFFANQAHPLRKLLSDMVELAVSAQTSESAQAQLRETMRTASALQTGPALVADALNSAQPVPEGEVEGFLNQMREQTRARREALLVRVRRQVAQELEVQTLGRRVPDPVMDLLRGGVGPLMAVRLLKNGRGSGPYQEAQSMMEGVLKSLEFIPPASPEVLETREQLLSKIVTALADIGMTEDKVESLLNGLQEVYKLLDSAEAAPGAAVGAQTERLTEREEHLLMSEIDQQAREKAREERASQAAASPPTASGADAASATVMDLLRRLLAPESWFRVYDAEHNQTRWLKLNSFYPDQDSVTFTGFDESLKLSIRANRFAEHLASGQSEPINPDDSAREALEQLRRGKNHG